MPEIVIKYKGNKALKAIRNLARHFDIEIMDSTDRIFSKNKLADYLPITFSIKAKNNVG